MLGSKIAAKNKMLVIHREGAARPSLFAFCGAGLFRCYGDSSTKRVAGLSEDALDRFLARAKRAAGLRAP